MSGVAKFTVGHLVHHKLFDYRGVVFDLDSNFDGSDEWYEHVARSRPPKDEPWYHVLVDGAVHTTYVAEQNLEADQSQMPIAHPYVTELFEGLCDGTYVAKQKIN